MRHEGLHMEWSYIWSFAKLKWKRQQYKWMVDLIQDVTWRLEMVKIARKDFEVLSKGEGQAIAWRLKNLARVKKKVLAFSWNTNQAMMIILRWRIKSILDKLLEVTWYIWSKFTSIEWNQVTYSRWLWSRRKSKLTCWHPHLMKIGIHDFGWKRSTQKV